MRPTIAPTESSRVGDVGYMNKAIPLLVLFAKTLTILEPVELIGTDLVPESVLLPICAEVETEMPNVVCQVSAERASVSREARSEQQVDALKLLDGVPNGAVLVTEQDLNYGRRPFVFGIAHGDHAAVSAARTGLQGTRLKKLVIHELGHMLGLTHHEGCVMAVAASVEELDMLPEHLCSTCLHTLATRD